MKERAEEPLNPKPLDARRRERRVRRKWVMVEGPGMRSHSGKGP